jgi:hypothetical protein
MKRRANNESTNIDNVNDSTYKSQVEPQPVYLRNYTYETGLCIKAAILNELENLIKGRAIHDMLETTCFMIIY